MSAAPAIRPLCVRIHARDAAVRTRIAELAHACAFAVTTGPHDDGPESADQATDTVLVAAAPSLDAALEEYQGAALMSGSMAAGVISGPGSTAASMQGSMATAMSGSMPGLPSPSPSPSPPTPTPAVGRLLVAEAFSMPSALRAVRAGAVTMLRLTTATPAQFAAAVDAARCGEGMLPYEVLVRALGGGAGPAPGPAPDPHAALTGRQLTVLALVADGYGNAAIARTLSCSEHTVKNVIYDLTARLQVRNRAQAVAWAVRIGLI